MGCFSSCFRIKDDHRTRSNRFTQPITAIPKEPVDPLARDCVWSLLAHEDEDEDISKCEEGRCGVIGSGVLDEELRAEAKFLKACGTLPQTPVEIRKTKKSKDPHYGDTQSESNSRLPNTAIEFDEPLPKQIGQLQSPIDLFQKWENKSDSSSHLSNSLKNKDSMSSNSVEGCTIEPAASTHFKNKSVRFESQNDSCSLSSKSPYPTPLKLTDDMETPGTVFTSNSKNSRMKHLGETRSVEF
ncbi:hypothetical protein R6Q59_030028 [Mikania micrantha]